MVRIETHKLDHNLMLRSYNLKSADELVRYKANSRTHSSEQIQQIVASITEFGFTNPLLIDENNIIIAGHGRLEAALFMGLSELPCITLDGLTDTQKSAYVIADNKLALNAGWDFDILKGELELLQGLDFDIALTGFDEGELLDLFPVAVAVVDGLCDEDDVPDAPAAPVVRLGDVWLLGDSRLMCGSSTVVTDVERLMDGHLADLLITDPPYNVAYTGKTKDAMTIENDAMNDESFRKFLYDAMFCANIAMRDGASFYIWHADSEGYNFRGACQDVGFKVRECLIWVKNTLVMGRQDYHWKHEPCLYGWKSGAAHFWNSDRKQTTVLEFDRQQRNDIHPTMKPVDLIEYQMLNNTKLGGKVLDLFGGSGTTLIAATKNNRKCYMMELDPKYVQVILERYKKFTGKDPLHEESGKTYTELLSCNELSPEDIQCLTIPRTSQQISHALK